MKQAFLFIFAVLILFPACSKQNIDPALGTYIDSLMNASFKVDEPGAVILVARDGEPVFRRAYGRANLELNVPNTPENVFAIASMTKQFTAVCVLQLVQEGKLSLGDDIRKYLPTYNTHGRVITIEHLLTHTNGIPNITFHADFIKKDFQEPTREELLHCAENDSLLFEPGTDWSYNDVGFMLAALIVERVSGMPFHDYMRKNIFEPAGMKNTTFWTRERVIPGMVSGYTAGDASRFRPEEYSSCTWDFGMGDIVTTVDDMLRWDEALYTEKLVKKELLEKAWSSYVLANGRKTNYGYGWNVVEWQGVKIITHPGALGGFRSFSLRIPSRHLFVVYLSNNALVGYNGLMEFLAARLLGISRESAPARALSPQEVKEYTGLYEMRFARIVSMADVTREKRYRKITSRDTVLYTQQPGGNRFTLKHVGEDLFVAEDRVTFFHFLRNEAGRVVALEWHLEPITFGVQRSELKTDLPLPKEPIPAVLDETTLGSFIGKYNFGGDHTARVRVEGGHMYMEGVGELLPESETRFVGKDYDGTVEFLRNSKGVVTGLLLKGMWVEDARKVE